MKMPTDLATQLEMAIAIIRELAEANGYPPNKKEFEKAARGRSFGAPWFRDRHGITFADLLDRAGFEPNRRGPSSVERRRIASETEAYIDHARETRLRRSPWVQEWPLLCVESSVRHEVREARQRDGSIVRIERTFASLR